METMAGGKSMFPEAGTMLARLHEALVRWLRRRIRCVSTAMDVASEVAHRAMRRFFFDRCPASAAWLDLWRWALRVARNLLIDRAREVGRARCELRGCLDDLAARGAGDSESGRGCGVLVEELFTLLRAPEQETLRCLVAGVHSNEAIAALRGRRLRAVQESRGKIREAAMAIGNVCRSLHPRTFVPM